MQGALSAVDGLAAAIPQKELHGALREQAAYFATAAFFTGNDHRIVAGRLVTEPGDGGGLGALLEGDALGACDGAAADGRGVLGDEIGEGRGFEAEGRVEVEEADDGVAEIDRVVLLVSGAALATGVKFSLIRGAGAFENESGAQDLDAGGGGPDSLRETFAAFDFDDGEGGAVLFDAPAQRGVAGRDEYPVRRHGFEHAVLVEDVAGEGSGTDFAGKERHRMVAAGGGGSVAEWSVLQRKWQGL